jgi:heptosyltransferase-2
MSKRILIIKLGYCETLVNEQGFVPSLGDVFRHTVLLHRYSNDHVTWLTSESALPLLKDNPLIDELICYNGENAQKLKALSFDEILCIEKAQTICKLAKSIPAHTRYGFGWNGRHVDAHPMAQPALDIANGKDHFLPIQALLYQMVSDYWNGEDYILGYTPRKLPRYDVGLNFRVGSKWPTKSWPAAHWETLAALCHANQISISWQEGAKDTEHYMDWINAGRIIVTCDSLGMHLGLALKKRVIALFGPTPSDGIYMYGRGIILRANWSCLDTPCLKPECKKNALCMAEIQPEMVFKAITNMLNRSGKAPPSPVRNTASRTRKKRSSAIQGAAA